MSDLNDLTLSQVSDMLAEREISAVELVEANLRAIEKDRTPGACLCQCAGG